MLKRRGCGECSPAEKAGMCGVIWDCVKGCAPIEQRLHRRNMVRAQPTPASLRSLVIRGYSLLCNHAVLDPRRPHP